MSLVLICPRADPALSSLAKLPAFYPRRSFVVAGGLISYEFDALDQIERAAGYVDRILKGEKPADLPVQAPTKYELAINLKTSKTLGSLRVKRQSLQQKAALRSMRRKSAVRRPTAPSWQSSSNDSSLTTCSW
jgi:hypothetical protein